MRILNDRADMDRALNTAMPTDLYQLLATHINHTIAAGLDALTRILVIDSDDARHDLDTELGLSLLRDVDGEHWNTAAFVPRHDWTEKTGGWFVTIVCASDTGFATIVIIQDRGDDLGEFCRHFTFA